MQRIARKPLSAKTASYLEEKQAHVDASESPNIERLWKAARTTKSLGNVLSTLRAMCGPRERCMYCLDSHGCDIEHFRPKAAYPGQAFRWPNMLLCCTECGRFKGDRFPTHDDIPLLIDPTLENPWLHLDFDPKTGNIDARFDLVLNDWSLKGTQTVEVLRLNQREALSVVYRTTFRRLANIVRAALVQPDRLTTAGLWHDLIEADDHGLLTWCFGSGGQATEPFQTLHQRYPALWAECASRLT